MGEKKRRIKSFGQEKILPIREFIYAYQVSLRVLINYFGNLEKLDPIRDLATVGKCEIWPCEDGAVILIYKDEDMRIAIDQKDPVSKTIRSFMKDAPAMKQFDDAGNQYPIIATIDIIDPIDIVVQFGELLVIAGETTWRSKFQHGFSIGWEANLEDPDEVARKDFEATFIVKNIVGQTKVGLTSYEIRTQTKIKTEQLVKDFQEKLDSNIEEDVQSFLSQHPQLIYPEYVKCMAKYPLGEDYKTDFIFEVLGSGGKEYILVEIESPGKKIFTQSGQFKADFTQAKNQLLDWERWITHNQAYIERKLEGIYKPKYHLIMGRSSDLTVEDREKLRTEFSGGHRIFSTFDDLIDRFLAITERVYT